MTSSKSLKVCPGSDLPAVSHHHQWDNAKRVLSWEGVRERQVPIISDVYIIPASGVVSFWECFIVSANFPFMCLFRKFICHLSRDLSEKFHWIFDIVLSSCV